MFPIKVIFTRNSGQPALGLALADIDVYLVSERKSDGLLTAIWNPQNPTLEVGGGMYYRAYVGDDPSVYTYSAWAIYTGAVVLDSDYSLMAAPYMLPPFSPGAVEYQYTVTDSVTLLPIEGVEVWITTDAAGNNVIWNGDTDAFGVARDDFGYMPFLDPGQYFFWKQRVGYVDDQNPDIENVP